MIQTFFDFPVYFKFFIGLFALVNPVGIIPVFISMTSYQTAAARNKTNLTANLSVAIILWISLFLGDTILQLFGISIDSFRIAGGILVVTIAMSMISGKLGEDKQNKQEKSETAVRESIGVVPLALPLMAGPGAISSTIVWGTRYHSISYLFGFFVAIALFAWGLNLSLLVLRGFSPACLINSFQMKRSCHAPFTSSLFLLCSRAVIKSKRNR